MTISPGPKFGDAFVIPRLDDEIVRAAIEEANHQIEDASDLLSRDFAAAAEDCTWAEDEAAGDAA